MRAVKIVGKVLAGLLALCVVAIGGLYAQTQWKITQKAVTPTRAKLVVVHDSATRARGARLTVADGCTDCHTKDLGGQVMADAPAFGRLAPSNLTSGEGGIAARYDDAGLDAAIRDGVGWDGRKLIFMPSHEYAGLADNDVRAIIAHLRTVAPVNRNIPPMRLGPIARGLMATGKMVLLPNDVVDHGRTTLAMAPSGGTVEQGRYLAAGCTGCHGKDYAGGPIPGGPPGGKPSANITPSGRIGKWSEAEFVKALREGARPDGSAIDPSMPWKAMGKMTDEELQGVYRYLKTLPPAVVKT
jgi:cytochrome c553